MRNTTHQYCVYGIGIASDSPLGMPQYAHPAQCHVECLQAPASVFQNATSNAVFHPESDAWHRYALLDDGSTYARWDTVGEFLIAADGRQIVCRRVEGSTFESFQVYMLGQALSFALVKQGFEPLHATVVVVNHQAVAFLGGSAFGKSTLAACFLGAGARLLTDDLLMLQPSPAGILAYPGPPRIKLFPQVACRFLGAMADGVKMNADTAKLIVPLDERRSCTHPVPLKAIYSLASPSDTCRQRDVSIEPLSARDSFMELIRGTFNRRITGRTRLERQFETLTRLAELTPVRKLVYPRVIDRLDEVRDLVREDLLRNQRTHQARDSWAEQSTLRAT